MTLSAHPQPALRFGRLVGGTVLGSVLVAAGLLTAYLTIATPLVSTLVPDAPSGGGHVAIGLGVWSFALIAGGALLVAGTSRLAIILAILRTSHGVGGPAARAFASTPDDVVVASGVIPREGRPIPELVLGAFGAAVVHELPPSSQIRHGRAGWESRRRDGWEPMEDPLDVAMRDADRVRRWLSTADLDFVVRVYAALVVSDRTLQRSPTCAVISAEQIPAWMASLPPQRTLTAGRRGRLLAMAQSAGSAEAGSRE
jgi:hypothetical protein